LTTEQVDDLLAACDGDSPSQRRDRAILLCWRATGFGLAMWRNFASLISSGKPVRCWSAGSLAIKFVSHFRKRLETRSSPIWNAGLLLVRVIVSFFETSLLSGHSSLVRVCHRWQNAP
jgi:hypothetical protein